MSVGARPAIAREDEVDLRVALAPVRRFWPLVLAGLLLGGVTGYLSVGPGTVLFQARTLLYVTQTSGLARPSSLAAIAHSPSVLAPVARRTGLPLDRLERSLAAAAPGGAVAGPAVQTFQISVTGRKRRATLAASRLIALALLGRLDDYRVAQQARYRADLLDAERDLAATARRAELARELGKTDRVAELTATGLVVAQQAEIERRVSAARLGLVLAQAQRSQVISSSVARVSARTRRTSMLVGAAIGLIAGGLGALALTALRGRG